MNNTQALRGLTQEHQDSNNNALSNIQSNHPAIEFFNISLTRLVLMSLVTFNLYTIYWFYRNWFPIKKAEKGPIWPFWRAIFAIFFVHIFFEKVYVAAKNSGYKPEFSYEDLAFFI